jgi:hypothetical protein
MKEILSHIKLRPNMILNESTLENLNAFMNGYMYRIFQVDDVIPEFYPGFQKYIEEFYNDTTNQHWSKIISINSKSEKAAFDRFFMHLEEYTKIDADSK